MMKLWSQCCAEKAVSSNNTNPLVACYVQTPVKSNSKEDHLNARDEYINELPTEILFIILKSLDKVSLLQCYLVCKRWRNIVFYIIEGDKTNMMWYFLCRQYQLEGFYQQNSNSNCLFPFRELIESSLKWNYKCSLTLAISVPVIHAVRMNVYREYIIVVTSAGVKYFDKETFKIKKIIRLDECYDFIENDYMVARSIKYDNDEGYKLQLFGKRSFDDNEWESQIFTSAITQISTTQELDVRVWKIQEDRCFVVLKSNNTLNSYDWRNTQTPIEWHRRFRCRLYVGMGEVIAMKLTLEQVHLLTSSGALFCCERGRDGVVSKVYKFSGFMHTCFVQLVHRCSLVLSVPEDCQRRMYRIRKSNLPTLYRLEIPKLTCVTEHGIILFLGYSDGKIEIVKPLACSREHMFTRSINLSMHRMGPPAPVLSIVVHVDDGKQSLFVATTSCVYRFTPAFPDVKNIWDMENLVSPAYYPSVDLVSI